MNHTPVSLENLDPILKNLLFVKSSTFHKKEKTNLRSVRPEELGQSFDTWVKTEDGIRRESQNVITSNRVVAQNPHPIAHEQGKPIYNEWLVDQAIVVKNYGQEVLDSLTSEFSSHQKKRNHQSHSEHALFDQTIGR